MMQAKFVMGLIVSLLLGVGIALFGADYASMKRASAQNEQRGQVLTNTSAGAAESIDIDEFQAGYNAALNANRDTFKATKQEAIRNEPETAARAVRPVPDSVRNAYRERRLARERLGCAGRECGEDH